MLGQENLTFPDWRHVSGCFESAISVSLASNFRRATKQAWLFARTYSERVQGKRQDLARVTNSRHKLLFLNNFNNLGAKE